jgi:L-iditol 2-dehydrogenase
MSEKPTRYPFLHGGFAEYGYVFPTSGRVRVPDSLSDVVASAASCAARTMVNGFDQLGRIEERHTVLIQGSGPLGLFATAMASTMGPRQVIVLGAPADRLELASRWGADHTIDVTTVGPDERREQVLDLTDGYGADVIIEVSGAPAAFNEGVDLLRRGGRYVIVGQIHNQQVPFNPSKIVMKQARLLGTFSGSVEHYARALTFLDTHSKRFDWDAMITSRHSLVDIDVAIARMQHHEDIKPAIVFDHTEREA